MGNFQLRTPALRYRRARPTLRSGLAPLRLTMPPQLRLEIRALRNDPPGPTLRRAFDNPNWNRMPPAHRASLLAPRTQGSTTQGVTGAPPAIPDDWRTARAGTFNDVLTALWSRGDVRRLGNRLLDDVGGRFRRDWRRLSLGQQVVLVSQTTVVAGTSLFAALRDDESRAVLLNLADREIPLDFILDGLSMRPHLRGPGLTQSDPNAGGRRDIGLELSIDLAAWVDVFR